MVAIFTGLGAGFERGSAAALGGGGLLGGSGLGRAGEGVFLNAATGNLLLERQDEFLVGRGPDLAVARTYNSQGALDDANNDDWRQSTDRRLVLLTGAINAAGSKITRVSADGSEIEYEYGEWQSGAFYYRATDGAGAHDKLTHAAGVWTWEEGSSLVIETYEAAESGAWRIASARDSDGNTLTFAYVSGDPTRLQRIDTANGDYIQYVWSGGNLVEVETHYTDLATGTPNQQLTRVTYEYDGQNRLIWVKVDLSPNDNSIGDGKLYKIGYTYDGISNRVASIAQNDGSALAIAYVNEGGVYKVSRLTQTVASGESRVTDILYTTAVVGPETFDIAEVRAYRDATLTSYVATTLKSAAGRLREVILPAAASGQGARTLSYTYDTQGNVSSATDLTPERTRLTEYVYDGFGNATQITVKLNGVTDTVTARTYANNNLTLETRTGSTASASATSLYTRYVYDGEHHLRFSISAEGRVVEYEYETTGELKRTIAYKQAYTIPGPSVPDEAAMTDWRNVLDRTHAEIKSFEYDLRGGLLRAYGFSGATSAAAENTNEGRSKVNSVYDQSGALLSRWVEGQQSESFVYDGLGRLIASTDLSGGTTHLHFVDDYFSSGNGAQTIVTTRALYNGASNDWDAIADSLITTSTFNRAGELISRAEAVGPGGPTTTVGTETYGYDKMGRLRWISDATARKSYFLYDDFGRKTADIGHDGQLTEYRYDATGRLVATIHYATAISTATIANAANAVVIADVRPGYNSSDIAQWTIYDADDRVVQTVQGDGSVTAYAYDAADRLVSTFGYFNKVAVSTFWANPPTAPVSVAANPAKDFVVRSFYDGDGILLGALNGEGYLSEYVYDAAGRKIQEIGYASATNAANRTSGTFAVLKSNLANAAADRSVRYVYDGQGPLRFTINALGQVSELRYWDGPTTGASLAARLQATGLVRETIVYASALGSLASYDYATVKTAVAALAGEHRVSRAVYNDRAQLVYAIDAAGAVTKNWYDASGRITKTARFSTLYTASFAAESSTWKAALDGWAPANDATRITRTYYNARSQASFVVDPEGYVTGFSYDSEGRVVSESRYANSMTAIDDTWTWSSVDGANKGSARTVSYAYDTLGRLQSVTDAAGRFEYFGYYNNGALAQKIEGAWADNARTLFYYDQAGNKIRELRATSELANATPVGATATQLTATQTSGPQQLVSPNGQYQLELTRLGQLQLYDDDELVWTNGAHEIVSGANYRLTAETNGNLVVYRQVSGQADVAIWSSNTAGSFSGATFIKLDNNGVFSLEKGTAPTGTGQIWNSATSGLAAINPSATTWVQTTFNYDGLGNLISVVEPDNKTTTYTYDRVGRVKTRTDAMGGVTSHEYDGFGRGVKTIDARGHASYAFFDQLGRVTSAVDAEGYVTRTAFTAFGEVASLTRHFQRATNTVSVTTPPTTDPGDTGAVTSFLYDKLGRVTRATDAENYYEEYALDAFGQRAQVRNKLGGITLNQYDALGRLTQETLPVNSVRADGTTQAASITNKFEYDSCGNRTKLIEAFGLTEQRTTNYEYDGANRLSRIAHDSVFAVASATDAVPGSAVARIEEFFYDSRGNVIEKRDATGARTLFWYDKLDHVTHELSATGTLTRHFYDKNGNRTESRVYAAQLTGAALPADAKGAPPFGTGASRITQYVYDGLNRLTQQKTLNVRTAVYAATLAISAPTTLITAYEYDATGNVVRVTDANGKQTWSYYDKLGRKTIQIDAANYRTDWAYNSDGNAVTETRFASASVTPTSLTAPPPPPTASTGNDRITEFVYDRMGRRTQEKRLNVKVFNGTGDHATTTAVITYAYNGLGLVTSKSEATGDQITYGYDAGGRILSEQRSGYTDVNGLTVTPRIEYAYNGLDDLTRTRALGASGAVSAGDRVTTYAYGAGGRLLSITDAENFTRIYNYDVAGQVRREEYVRVLPTGTSEEAVGYDYDAEGRVTKQGVMLKVSGSWARTNAAGSIDTTVMKYNAFGQVSERGTNDLYAEKFYYNAAGQLERTNAGDGVWKYFVYDAAGNQTLMLATVGADFGAAALDALGEVLALWTGGTATIATTNVSGVVATITKYDARNQAIEVLEPKREVHANGVLTPSDLLTARAYNAFGEVTHEINAAGARVDYTYNTMGRLIETESPAVSITGENGAVTNNFRPTEHLYCDAAGRVVASRDANNYLTRYTLLAGTGYGGSQALHTEVFTPDGAVTRTRYDIHGDARRIEDPLYDVTKPTLHVTTQTFDRMGRLVQMTRAASLTQSLTDYHAYDGLGHRIKHANSFYNSTIVGNPHYNANFNALNPATWNNAASTAYDHQGRVVQVVAAGGDTTKYAYAWDGALTANGMSATPFGGWVKTTTFANGKALTEKSDVFGHEVGKLDMSAHTTHFTYDKAGRLIQRNATHVPVVGQPAVPWGHTLYQSYFNTGRLKEIHQLTDTPATMGGGGGLVSSSISISYRGSKFGYDKLGNVVSQDLRETGTHYWETQGHYDGEGYWEPGESGADPFDFTISSQSASYDALGRIVSWSEAGSGAAYPGAIHYRLGAATHNFFYDAAGNIRRSLATYRALDAHGAISATNSTQDYWYRYDAMNRMVTSKGVFVGAVGSGSIQRGNAGGVDTFYNWDGTRAYALTSSNPMSHWREQYYYDAVGRVLEVKAGSNPAAEPTGRVGLISYDALGRLLTQSDYNGTSGYLGGGMTYSRAVVYNAKNQIVSDDSTVHHSDNAYRELSTYDYGDIVTNADGSVNVTATDYALGSALQVDVKRWKDNVDGNDPDKRTKNTYHWYDGAVAATIKHAPSVNLNDPNWETNSTLWTTTYTYDTIGGQAILEKASIQDGRPRTVAWTNDMLGQVVRRSEKDNQSGGDPHEIWHRFSGRQMGYVGNNGNYDVTYHASRGQRQTPGSPGPGSFADFDLAHDHINSYEQGSKGGVYTVQSGDTLQGIAAALWGDASLWYKIAEVNGLTASSTLIEGQPLLIPVGVQRNENNAATYQPYDPLEVLGNTSPTSPKPKTGGCGVMGQVILVVIAVVVSVFTAGAALAAITPGLSLLGAMGTVLSGGLLTAAGSTAMAVGIGAAAGAAGSIVSQGIGVATGIQDKFSWNAVALAAIGGGIGAGTPAPGNWQGAVTGAIANNVLTQRIGTALGLQDKFSWAGVAAAGVGAGVGFQVNQSFGAALSNAVGDTLTRGIVGGASAIASAATRSLMNGGDFGDNIMAALPDVIGQTIGEAIAGGIASHGDGPSFEGVEAQGDAEMVMEPVAKLIEKTKQTRFEQMQNQNAEDYFERRRESGEYTYDDESVAPPAADHRTFGERLIDEGMAEIATARDARRERDWTRTEMGTVGGIIITEDTENNLREFSGILKIEVGGLFHGSQRVHEEVATAGLGRGVRVARAAGAVATEVRVGAAIADDVPRILSPQGSLSAASTAVTNHLTGRTISATSRLPRSLGRKLENILYQSRLGGNRGVRGSVGSDASVRLGLEFVGPNFRVMSGGRGLLGPVEDIGGVQVQRVVRFAAPKSGVHPISRVPFSRTGLQANFETWHNGQRASNVHLDVWQ